ncbi:unnamed protein product [Owenia fusiformis]|uniref:Uncharacterized protein n=1 Tax=Owenia fusiformis TaxID=6347 RepID=A0A8J1UB73_OWEFU|nr:unnamed protein product [Owenia fusiformis]
MVKTTHLFKQMFYVCVYFGNTVEIKHSIFIKIANTEVIDNITKIVGDSTASSCALQCLLNDRICESYNLRRVEGSNVKICELIGASNGLPVPDSLSDHFYSQPESTFPTAAPLVETTSGECQLKDVFLSSKSFNGVYRW